MADARGEYWYLEDGVEPSKITVPELRSILLKHGVQYPSSAKKPALLELFTSYVLPQASKIQRAAARTVRSTRGITDVPSSTASTTTSEDMDDDTLLPPPSTTRRTLRRTARGTTAEEEETPMSRRAKTPSRTVPTKHARDSDADVDARPTSRRSRKSFVLQERTSPDPEAWHSAGADSPFTQENPFQSGSSPPNPDSHAKDRRRKTLGLEYKEKRKSDANRRRTYQSHSEQQDDGVVVPTQKTFEMRVPRRLQEEAVVANEDTFEGEEYTPEEQLELEQASAQSGQVDVLPPRRRRDPQKTANTIQAFLLTFLAASFAVIGGVWREEKFGVGFCGVGTDAPTAIAGVDIPDWAVSILPECEPCPPHAFCERNLEVQCENDFVKKYHPLSFGGFLPFPPTCEPDTEKTRKVTAVADHAVHLLRERRAQYECGEPDAEGKVVQTPELSVTELKEELLALKTKSTKSKGKGMSNEEFEDLFAKAIGEIPGRAEIVEKTDGSTGVRRLASTSHARLTLACSIRRSVRESLEQYLLQIVGIVLFFASGAFGKYKITSSRTTEARAKQLASDVFDRLANQASLSNQEPGTYQERGLSMNQLRDDVLRNEFSSSRRINLWKRVQKKVEHNSNVRAAVREGHSGDVTRMWEWIGPVQMLEDVRSSGGRRSLGWTPGSSPPEMKWDEGRPQY